MPKQMFFSFLIVWFLDFWTARRKDGFPLETREARTCCPETLSNTALFFSLQIYQVKANETRPNLTCKCQNLFYAMLIKCLPCCMKCCFKRHGRQEQTFDQREQTTKCSSTQKENKLIVSPKVNHKQFLFEPVEIVPST